MLTELLDRLIKYNPLEDLEEAIINLNTKRAIQLLKRYPKLARDKNVIFLVYQKRNATLIKYLLSILPQDIIEEEIQAPKENSDIVLEDYFKDYPS
jgi:hypothetical protein